MTTVVVEETVDQERVRATLAPRDDMVQEQEVGEHGDLARSVSARFALRSGPFEHYERLVEVTPRGDGTYDIRETTDFDLAIPVWGWMFRPLVKRAIRKPPTPGQAPWWSPPDKFDVRASRTLSFLCVFSAITGYLGVLLSQTNPYFQAEFGATDTEISFVATAVRLSGLLALIITAIADRRGRKTILIVVTYVGIVMTALGGLAPNLVWLGGTQTMARACASAMGLLIAIMAVEEMPAGSRAFAVSVLTMSGAVGAGAVVLFLQVGEASPWAWRIFFLVPLSLLMVMPKLRQVLPETRRFELYEAHELDLSTPDAASAPQPAAEGEAADPEVASAGPTREPVLDPLVGDGMVDMGSKRRRFLALGSTAFLFAVFFTPASFYMNKWLKVEQGYNGLRITLLQVLTNVPFGGLAIVVGGKLADKYGRRLIGAIGVAGGVGFTVLMYLSTGYPIWITSTLATTFGAMSVPALGVYGPELFGTSSRGTANGGLNLLGIAGSVVGLVGAARLAESLGGYSSAIPLLGLGPMLVVFIILVFYPETANKELEELNPEDSPPPTSPEDIEHLEHELKEAHEHGGHVPTLGHRHSSVRSRIDSED